MIFIKLIFTYILTILVSYIFFNLAYRLHGESAKHNPHGLTILYMLIPILNVITSFGIMFVALIDKAAESKRDFNFKKFFGIK